MVSDRKDYIMAFVIGAIVGVGATLLATPAPKQKRKRLVYDMAPTVKRVKRRVRPSRMQRRARRLRELLHSR
jgi:hypothetical protein